MSRPQLDQRARQLGLASVQRLEGTVDLALLPTIFPALALTLHQSGDRCSRAEPLLQRIEIGQRLCLGHQGLCEGLVGIAHSV